MIVPAQLLAQVYSCNGRYSSRPCEETNFTKKGVSKIGNAYFQNNNVSEAKEKSRDTQRKESDPQCRIGKNGTKLLLQGLSIRKEVSSSENIFHLVGSVYNDSSAVTVTPVTLVVSNRATNQSESYHITDTVPSRGSVSFTLNIAQKSLTEAASDKLLIFLAYEPASFCDSKVISLSSSANSKAGVSVLEDGESKSDLKQQLQDLKQRIKKAKQNSFGQTQRESQQFNSEIRSLNKLRTSICMQLDQLENQSSYLESECIKLAKELANIGS